MRPVESMRTDPAAGKVRVAVIDIGTNSTRLLVADVTETSQPKGGQTPFRVVTEVERRSTVTRLGRGVDTSGTLAAEAIEDVCAAVGDYIEIYRPLEPDRLVAIATSAVRDADNGSAFLAELRERFALDARVVDGAEEARLTYLGVTSAGDAGEATLVVDIGGGSTELVLGSGREVSFFASLQAGTVRHTERHLSHDPPRPEELEALAADLHGLIARALADKPITGANHGIAVAGTPTSLAAIDQELDPYDPDLVHGHVLSLPTVQRMLSSLASMPLDERLEVKGLHPGRAPTIVAGVVILVEVMRAFGLAEIEVSEHDILWGTALDAAGAPARAA
jgi:exopolyphosphatase/guanosine-5'-triphosphate,3'-diphosphate pyrophosphatase